MRFVMPCPLLATVGKVMVERRSARLLVTPAGRATIISR